MDEKEFNDLKEYVQKVLHECHLSALQGIAPHEFLRSIGESIDIKYAYREERSVEHNIEEFNKAVEEHFVKAAQKTENDAVKKALKATKHLYKAIFNIMIFEKGHVQDLEKFAHHVLRENVLSKNKTLKLAILEALKDIASKEKSETDAIHKEANALYASAKDHNAVTLALTKMLHTHGASYMRRKQEFNDFKDGHKDEVKAEGMEKQLLHPNVKSVKEYEEKLKAFKNLEMESIDDYNKALKLMFIEWEEVDEYLHDMNNKVGDASAKHELPGLDKKQMDELSSLIVGKVIEAFAHSIRKAVNQMEGLESSLNKEIKNLS